MIRKNYTPYNETPPPYREILAMIAFILAIAIFLAVGVAVNVLAEFITKP